MEYLAKFKNLDYRIWLYPLIVLMMGIYIHGHKKTIKQELMGIHIWRQTQTQLNIQQFVRKDFNIFNPRSNTWNGGTNIKRFEFPIMQWLVAAVQKVTGESIFMTRLSMLIFTFLGFLGFYKLNELLTKNKFISFIAASLFLLSPLIYYYGIAPIPDIFALLCTIWHCYFFLKYVESKFDIQKYVYASAFFLGLATLSKLPYAIFGIMPLIALFDNYKDKLSITSSKGKTFILCYTMILVLAGLWYVSALKQWGTDSIVGGILNGMEPKRAILIIEYHLTYTFKHFFFNSLSLLYFILCLIITLIYIFKSRSQYLKYLIGISIMVILYFLYELNMIDTLHDYYMMPFLIPLYLIVLFGLHKLYQFHPATILLPFIFLWAVPSVSYKETKRFWTPEQIGFDNTLYQDYKEMRKLAEDDARCIILNDDSGYILPYFFDKEGYVFTGDNLPMPWIEDMILNQEAKYMYSNSRKVEADSTFSRFIDTTLYSKGNYNVFKLKSKEALLSNK